jgi:hypothetical protein
LLLRTDHVFERGAKLRGEVSMGHKDHSDHATLPPMTTSREATRGNNPRSGGTGLLQNPGESKREGQTNIT